MAEEDQQNQEAKAQPRRDAKKISRNGAYTIPAQMFQSAHRPQPFRRCSE